MSDRSDRVEIFTDGACRGNPGPGGWGALLRYKAHEKEISGAESGTTNNRMELMAAIKALEILRRPSRVRISTDSTYLKNGITQWIAVWKRKNWRTSDRKEVKNVDLWQWLERVASGHEIEWVWVKGHAGHEGNERADALAREAIAKIPASQRCLDDKDQGKDKDQDKDS